MFAKINPDLTNTGMRQAIVTTPGPVPGHPDKPYWVPVVEETDDTSTGPDKVVSPWVETVEVARLLRTRTIRDKTAGEILAEDRIRVKRLMTDSGVNRALARTVFGLVNDVRILRGQNAISLAQFEGNLEGMIRS